MIEQVRSLLNNESVIIYNVQLACRHPFTD